MKTDSTKNLEISAASHQEGRKASKTVNNLLFATFGVIFSQMVGSSRSFILAKLIDPAEYGIWTGVQLIVTLAPIVCLGTVEALLKQVPRYRGKNDLVGLRKIEGSVFATLVIASLIVAIVFLAFGGVLPIKFVRENLLLVQITASASAIGFFRVFYYHRCAAHEDFRSVSEIDALQSLIGFACVLFCAAKWGLPGGVIGYFLGECLTWVCAGYLCGKAHGDIHPCFKPSLMGDAVRVGFPITIIWWVYALQATMGRMAAISFLGNTQTGYYGAGSSLAMLFALVPNTIGRVFYPRVNAEVGGKAGLDRIRESVISPTSAIALVLPVLQIVIFFLLPIVYHDFLPKYKEGLTCAQILIFGAFFVGLIRNGANYLIAVEMQMRLMKYVLISLAVNAAGCFLATSLGFGINGLAGATALASALLASLIWKRVFVELEYARKGQFFTFINFYSSFFAMLVAVVLVKLIFSGFVNYSRMLLLLQMMLALGILGIIAMSFAGTRSQIKRLFRQGRNYFFYRFGQALVK